MNRSERRSWDRLVAEAREVTSEIELPDGEVLVVHVPNADHATAFQRSLIDPDASAWDQLALLLGEGNLAKLKLVAEDVPFTALTALLEGVLEDLGLRAVADAGNSPASSS